MRTILKLMIAMTMLALPVQAQESPVKSPVKGLVKGLVVVELFTAQGCVSCPPANAFLQELAARDDVLALAMHVDYWDYIGWKDSFASPDYTARQRAYAKAGGGQMIYTPQMIINGKDRVVGTRTLDVVNAIDRNKSSEPYVSLEIARDGSQLSIRAEAGKPLDDRLTVQLIRYRPLEKVDIRRGENAGRSISYVNIVTKLQVLQQWDTKIPLELVTSVSGNEPVVVLLQHEGYGPVAAVARLR